MMQFLVTTATLSDFGRRKLMCCFLKKGGQFGEFFF